MVVQTLQKLGHPLSDPLYQLQVLEGSATGNFPRFSDTLAAAGLPPLHSDALDVLQINVGRLCNQTCRHCHVDAGPDRREIMTRDTLEHCLRLIDRHKIRRVDVTGGAPEMNPHFEWFVSSVRELGTHVIDRCNLTILSAPGFTHLPEFLAQHQVEIVASLPCYFEENCDRQRGDGVFQKSVASLRRLNELGYGRAGTELTLSLVYNPVGPSLPPSQSQLEAAYKEQLRSRYGIEFNSLYTITNMPISRFLDDLLQSGRYAEYMEKLISAFNPRAVAGLMCRSTLSVDWQGYLYDCDFNQMLGLAVEPAAPQHIRNFDPDKLQHRSIVTGRHCYGCTAGAGSSCQGVLV